MDSPITAMLAKYEFKNTEDYKNALKEIIQEITLCGLSRGNFFSKAAFYGGTALRIFYGLDRFSEDLDFSLETTDENFDISHYFSFIETELLANGFSMTIEQKSKSKDTAVQSAFIKGETVIHLIKITPLEPPVSGISRNDMLKIKFEIDTNPPTGATYEEKYSLLPIPFSVRLYDKPSLFAGKLHAVLCRGWSNRIKGRDFYDYVWYLSQNTPVNLIHLKNRLIQTGNWNNDENFTLESLKKILTERFEKIDFTEAKKDVFPFIKDTRKLDVWSKEFFCAITDNLRAV